VSLPAILVLPTQAVKASQTLYIKNNLTYLFPIQMVVQGGKGLLVLVSVANNGEILESLAKEKSGEKIIGF
jgi:hypothetical protein